MIHKIVNAVLGKNYVATALLYTGLALSLFAITPSQAGITNAGEEDSFGFFCLVCDTEEVTFTTNGEAADVTIDGVEMHGTWTTTVTGHACKRVFFSNSDQECVKLSVRSIFQRSGSESWTYNVVVPNVSQCNLEEN